MTSLLDQMDVYVLPVFNIDGYDFTHKSVRYDFGPNFGVQASRVHAVLFILSDMFILSTSGTLEQDVEEDPLQEIWIQLHWSWSQQELRRRLVL